MQNRNQDTKIKLYHGSLDDIDKIDLNKGKSHKDFGPGFYATSQKRHAESIAKKNLRVHENRQRLELKRGNRLQNKQAYRYNLIFNKEMAKGLNVLEFKTASIDWLKFIVLNRLANNKAHHYDIVIGPTADSDAYYTINLYSEDLLNSNFNKDLALKVIEELKVDVYPKQYYFGTPAAIQTLTFDRIKRDIIH